MAEFTAAYQREFIANSPRTLVAHGERPASLCDDWDTSGGEEDGNVSDEDMSELEVSFNLVSTCLAWSEVVCVALMRGNFMNPEPFNSSANIKDE